MASRSDSVIPAYMVQGIGVFRRSTSTLPAGDRGPVNDLNRATKASWVHRPIPVSWSGVMLAAHAVPCGEGELDPTGHQSTRLRCACQVSRRVTVSAVRQLRQILSLPDLLCLVSHAALADRGGQTHPVDGK